MAVICGRCRHENEEGSKFCEICGSPLQAQPKFVEPELQPPTEILSKGQTGITGQLPKYDRDVSLEEVLQEQPRKRLKFEHWLRWFRESVELLDFYHTQDPPVVHGNINPSFIIYVQKGNLKLIHFKEGPEPSASDGISNDVFSLGATFHYLISGQMPNRSLPEDEATGTMAKPMKNYLKNFPDELQVILNKMLRLDPERRYSNCREVAEDLDDYLEQLKKQMKWDFGKISFTPPKTDPGLESVSTKKKKKRGMPELEDIPHEDEEEEGEEEEAEGAEKAGKKKKKKKDALDFLSPEQKTLVERRVQERKEQERARKVLQTRVRVVVAASILVAVTLLALFFPQIKYANYMRAGDSNLQQGRYESAVNYFIKARKTKPGKEEEINTKLAAAYVGRAEMYLQQGKFRETIKDLQRVQRLSPGHPGTASIFSNALDGLYERGKILYKEERYEEAVDEFFFVLDKYFRREYRKAYYWRGIAYVKTGRYVEGFNDLNKIKKLSERGSVNLDPGEEKKLSNTLGYIKKQLKREFVVNEVAQLRNKGIKAYQRGDHDDAVKFLERYIKFVSEAPKVKKYLKSKNITDIATIKGYLGASLLKLASQKAASKDLTVDEGKEVVNYCKRSIKYSPTKLNKKQCESLIGKMKNRIRVLKLTQEAQDSYIRGLDFYARGDYSKSIKLLKRFLNLYKQHEEHKGIQKELVKTTVVDIGKVRKCLGDSYYQRALEMKDKAMLDSEVRKEMVSHCIKSVEYDPTARNKSRCKDLRSSVKAPDAGSPAEDEAEKKTGIELYRRGEYKEAIAVLNKIRDKDAGVYTVLARSYERIGAHKKAVDNYGSAIRKMPGNLSLRKARADVNLNNRKRYTDALEDYKYIYKETKSNKSGYPYYYEVLFNMSKAYEKMGGAGAKGQMNLGRARNYYKMIFEDKDCKDENIKKLARRAYEAMP